jgi:hypothetical protein
MTSSTEESLGAMVGQAADRSHLLIEAQCSKYTALQVRDIIMGSKSVIEATLAMLPSCLSRSHCGST